MSNLENLTTRHIVELEDGKICFIGEKKYQDGEYKLVLFQGEDFGSYCGWSGLEYKKNSIIAIKEYPTTSQAIHSVISETPITNWDWQKESPAQIKFRAMQEEMEKFRVENNL